LERKSPQHDGGATDALYGTRQFYEERAEEYFRRTVSADLSHLYDRFLPHLPAGGRILDVGCGSGRDLRAFMQRGFRALGIDSSRALVDLARSYSGAECVVERIEDIAYEHQFNGVWACASLLHIPRAAIEDALTRIHRALLPGGVLLASVQEGEGEHVSADGRLYSFYNESEFLRLVKEAGFGVLEAWISQDVLEKESKRPIRWLNVLGGVTMGAEGSWL
jgi:SAM-dependent methyltransferase